MTAPLVVVDADVLGRKRTGDETYVENLLRELAALADDVRIAAVTRHPARVPTGIEPLALPARSQELRVAWSLPRLLGRVRPALAHFQHVVPPLYRGDAVVTVHDLSFERGRLMRPNDRVLFRALVPRSVARAARVFAVSERTKAELVTLYGVAADKIVVTPNGVDPVYRPDSGGGGDSYVLFVGAIEERKNPLAAARAAREVGLPLVVAGPTRDRALARELAGAGAELRGYVGKGELAELYRRAACLVLPSRYEGFGLPVVEAMASGTPVVATPDPALREVAGEAAVFAEPTDLAEAVRRAIANRETLATAGLERARRFSWRETARRTLEVYRELV